MRDSRTKESPRCFSESGTSDMSEALNIFIPLSLSTITGYAEEPKKVRRQTPEHPHWLVWEAMPYSTRDRLVYVLRLLSR